MAADKKTTAKVEAPKAAAVKKTAAAETKAAAVDTKAAEPVGTAAADTKAAEKKEAIKSEVAAVKKTVEKKAAETKKAVEKKAADTKKAVGRKAAAVKKTVAKKAEVKNEIRLQFSGKDYSQDDLLKIAKDVWKHDLKQKLGELESIELYVKPEESIVYYVMNKDFTGSFYI